MTRESGGKLEEARKITKPQVTGKDSTEEQQYIVTLIVCLHYICSNVYKYGSMHDGRCVMWRRFEARGRSTDGRSRYGSEILRMKFPIRINRVERRSEGGSPRPFLWLFDGVLKVYFHFKSPCQRCVFFFPRLDNDHDSHTVRHSRCRGSSDTRAEAQKNSNSENYCESLFEAVP